jgi:hypothetical protein
MDGDPVLDFNVFGQATEVCALRFEVDFDELVNDNDEAVSCDLEAID